MRWLPLVLLLAAALASAAQAYRGSRVYVAANADSGTPRFRPHSVWLSGDATLYVNHISWHGYNTATARGRGVGHANNCVPSCAQGHFTRHRASLRLWRPQRVCGRYFYSRVQVTWVGRPPSGSPQRIRLDPALHCR